MCLKLGEIGNHLIFVADAHQNRFHNPLPGLFAFLENEIRLQNDFTLILMGDIFDMLFGGVEYSIKPHQNAINQLKKIAQKRRVYYLEGNHDFNLQPIFSNMVVIRRENQPAIAECGGVRIALAHGDFAVNRFYHFYATCIRNPYLLNFLGGLDVCCKGKIFEQVEKRLQKQKISYFYGLQKEFIEHRMQLYDSYEVEWIFEGHYHMQGGFLQKNEKKYVGLPVFYCIQDCFIVKSYNRLFFIYSPIAQGE
ncbi:hypothetical protein CCZ01_06780 [Helicobacter monodelphidis]|uniref:UDP-2,3-diacylglucosamine diphosphatase n=1 Tax=Helicobacter sp. 15-1451 TaxID=2004995 RepID=UPI000DCBBCE4|nr:metallophosphoesterase [Helicobacter sp. 15-1451]RAX57275.1 hypothetical protein CCZ01_06780 [Helicobacter sp. 15-1451]